MIPDYQRLMRPVLEAAISGETRISEVIDILAKKFELSEEERTLQIPSGKQSIFANRVHWAKTYLKQAGLILSNRRGFYSITERGRAAVENPAIIINNQYLKQFEEYKSFINRSNGSSSETFSVEESVTTEDTPSISTPDEELRDAHRKITNAIAVDLLDKVRNSSPAFFENLIVDLLLSMGYGGSAEDAGKSIGQSGDGGVDGVIDQDPLGVDQIYLQAKRYAEGNNVSASAIRDFFGALSIKRAHKGIFFTTSSFTASAIQATKDLGSRIVLIDGDQLTKLMIKYNIGCRNEEVLIIKKIDEEYFLE